MNRGKDKAQQPTPLTAAEQALSRNLQTLVAQKRYPQAIRKLQQALKRNPGLNLEINESQLWFQQGTQEFKQGKYAQAETSLVRAIALGLYGQPHYWLGKSLLAQGKNREALNVFQAAFHDQTLPKDFGGCYLKLLLLNGEQDTVQSLLTTKGKRFYSHHLHWALGALALRAGQPETALKHFKQVGLPVTPGDHTMAWTGYAHQRAEDWPAAGLALGHTKSRAGGRMGASREKQHGAIQALALVQAAHTQGRPAEFMDLENAKPSKHQSAWVLELVAMMNNKQFHDAAHVYLDLPEKTKAHYPELNTLCRPLLLLAGEQALQQDEPGCTATFWGNTLNQFAYDPDLAVKLFKVLMDTEAFNEAERVVSRLTTWVQSQAKQQPQDWPEDRLLATQARLYCWQADSQMASQRYREATRSLELAAKLIPEHPEVLGRKGLDAYSRGNQKAAIPLLKQALEAGCQYDEVYRRLVSILDEQGDQEEARNVRQKFGQSFGDSTANNEVCIPEWMDALGFQNYDLLSDFVRSQKRPTPELKALRIFLDAALDQPSTTQKITLNQEQASAGWDELLQSHPPEIQVEILKGIFFVIQLHARRNKRGMAALQTR